MARPERRGGSALAPSMTICTNPHRGAFNHDTGDSWEWADDPSLSEAAFRRFGIAFATLAVYG